MAVLNFIPKLSSYHNYIIIVEGKKDVSALRSLGFNQIYALNEKGLTLKESIELISKNIPKNEQVCILTDFDKKGKELYQILLHEFQALGVKINFSLRELLFKEGISHIEGIRSYVDNHFD